MLIPYTIWMVVRLLCLMVLAIFSGGLSGAGYWVNHQGNRLRAWVERKLKELDPE